MERTLISAFFIFFDIRNGWPDKLDESSGANTRCWAGACRACGAERVDGRLSARAQETSVGEMALAGIGVRMRSRVCADDSSQSISVMIQIIEEEPRAE